MRLWQYTRAPAAHRTNRRPARWQRPFGAIAKIFHCDTVTECSRVAPLYVESFPIPLIRQVDVPAISGPIDRIDPLSHQSMKRRPRPIGHSMNEVVLHTVGMQIIHMLLEIQIFPSEVLPKTVCHNEPYCLVAQRRVLYSGPRAASRWRKNVR